jgi:hypothetical protein
MLLSETVPNKKFDYIGRAYALDIERKNGWR